MEVAKIVKKNLIVLLASIVVTLVLPFVAIKLLPPDADMIVIMTLLWVVNTVVAGGIGFYSGLSIKTCWFQPLIFVGLFALSAFVVWQGGEHNFFSTKLFTCL